NAELVSNILSSETGYAVYVDNNSQTGFWSDYNTLDAGDTGKLVYWTKDFTDILDFQADVARFDLHSAGRTVVNPGWDGPRVIYAGKDTALMPVVAGQRLSNPATDGGDPAGAFVGYRGVANLLINPGFENGLSGWNVNFGGSVTSTGAPYTGANF